MATISDFLNFLKEIVTDFNALVSALGDFLTRLNEANKQLNGGVIAGIDVDKFMGAFHYLVGDVIYSTIWLMINLGIYFCIFKLMLQFKKVMFDNFTGSGIVGLLKKIF